LSPPISEDSFEKDDVSLDITSESPPLQSTALENFKENKLKDISSQFHSSEIKLEECIDGYYNMLLSSSEDEGKLIERANNKGVNLLYSMRSNYNNLLQIINTNSLEYF